MTTTQILERTQIPYLFEDTRAFLTDTFLLIPGTFRWERSQRHPVGAAPADIFNTPATSREAFDLRDKAERFAGLAESLAVASRNVGAYLSVEGTHYATPSGEVKPAAWASQRQVWTGVAELLLSRAASLDGLALELLEAEKREARKRGPRDLVYGHTGRSLDAVRHKPCVRTAT